MSKDQKLWALFEICQFSGVVKKRRPCFSLTYHLLLLPLPLLLLLVLLLLFLPLPLPLLMDLRQLLLLLLRSYRHTDRHVDTLQARISQSQTKNTRPRSQTQPEEGRLTPQDRTSTATPRSKASLEKESQLPSQGGKPKPDTKKGGPTTRTQPKPEKEGPTPARPQPQKLKLKLVTCASLSFVVVSSRCVVVVLSRACLFTTLVC